MEIVAFVFEGLTALDVVGPYEVLQRVPGARVRFVAEEVGPVRTDNGFLALHADEAMADVTAADILLVPGGFATRQLEHDQGVLEWIRTIDQTTTWTTSVCTGSMLLAAAGLLVGLEATTHWLQLDRLAEYGASPTLQRVVEQGKIITAAGVSSGIDMALTLAAKLTSPEIAQAIQLSIEYDPQPPFDAGSPAKASPEIVELVRAAVSSGAR